MYIVFSSFCARLSYSDCDILTNLNGTSALVANELLLSSKSFKPDEITLNFSSMYCLSYTSFFQRIQLITFDLCIGISLQCISVITLSLGICICLEAEE